ncbi:MAG TPA: ROK family transcriptional regulator [Phototrophicaceae bacterium]|nr:ROK family transcriptional regulator [Phototrophicaceae bacterium]
MSSRRGPRGANLGQLGTFNQAVVLHAIRTNPGVSRVEIGGLTGLAGQTVTNICRRLLRDGLIVEGEPVAAGQGKPRTPLTIDAGARYAVGVHVDPALTTLVLLDLVGQTVAAERFATPVSADARATVAEVGRRATAFLAGTEVPRERVLGLGVATPGPVDLVRGVVDNPPHLPGWHQVPVRADLERAVGLPVQLEKDVVAAATAEVWAGTFAGATSAALIYLGTGIGAGLVVDGEVLRGASNNAGELGQIVVDQGGERCPCGQRGCTKVIVSAEEMVRRGGSSPGSQAELDAELRRLYDRADAGEERALEVVRSSAVAIVRAALLVTNLLDVERLVLGGPYWGRMSGHVLAVAPAMFAQHAAAHDIHPVELLDTPVGEHLAAVGAASLVLDRAYSPRPGSLVLAPPATGPSAARGQGS